MICGFCFGKHRRKEKMLSLPAIDKIIDGCAEGGIQKINIAGGEPFTVPETLEKTIRFSKEKGLIVGIISNGSLITEKWIQNNAVYIDWLGISIDSLNPETNLKIGRVLKNNAGLSNDYLSICKWIKNSGIQLKINTVVNKYNYNEIMIDFLNQALPERWKVLQVLPINEKNETDFTISKDQFDLFLKNHQNLHPDIHIFPENNEQMRGSYLMIDPYGRFYDNTGNDYRYSDPIQNVGFEKAYQQIEYHHEVFLARGGEAAVKQKKPILKF